MAKRVLGNDPFAGNGGESGGEGEGEGESAKSVKPADGAEKPTAKSRGTKRPPAPASKTPKGRTSRRPSVRASQPADPTLESNAPVVVPRAARVPDVVEMHAAAAAVDVESSGVQAMEQAAEEDNAPGWSAIPATPAVDESIVEGEPVSHAVSEDGRPLEEQIRDVEAQLDRLLDNAGSRSGDRRALEGVADRLRARIEPRGSTPVRESGPPGEDPNVFDVARELLSSDYYLRQWGRVAMRDRSEEVDDFGLDPKFAARIQPLMDFLYERWWRIEVQDVERVPSEGRVILCANHSGALPYDGAMLSAALRREHPARRELRWLAEDFVFHMPFLGVLMNRIGAVRACQENAERLLRKDACVGVFPEGVKGISKLYRDRYKLQRFGRGGHVKLAIRTRTPIVPVAIVGAEEAHPLIAPSRLLAKMLGVPYVPVTPTFPWLGPAGLMPLPSKWKIFFLDPIPMDGYAPDAADDDVLIGRLNEKIRGIIQDELDRQIRARKSVWKG